MFNQAIAGRTLPKRIGTDHDPLFHFHRWLANLRILAIEETKSVSHAPMSHPFVERLNGTTRRKFLDRALFWNSLDLHRKLESVKAYYNEVRVHRALNGTTPIGPANRNPRSQTLVAMPGHGIATDYSRLRSRHDQQFASHRIACRADVQPGRRQLFNRLPIDYTGLHGSSERLFLRASTPGSCRNGTWR
jgi:hypothetical protein